MSLILDALRKMEQERKARQGAAQDLRPEVLRYRSQMKQKQGKLPVIVCLFLVAVAVGAASFYIGKRDAGKFAMQHPAVQESAPGGPTAPPEAVRPIDDPDTAPSARPPAVTPYQPMRRVPASGPTDADPFATPPGNERPLTAVQNFTGANAAAKRDAAATPVRENRTTATRRQAEQAAAAQQAGAELPASEARLQNRSAAEVQQGAPSDITISGIAFQDERRLRRAVINGILVGEGEEVAGARVVEIKEHKVRMSRGGKLFDVPFGSGTSGM